MPYIPDQNRRAEMDEILELMKKHQVKADGDLNYLLFKFCKEDIKTGYNSLKNFCGELRQCATEVERRILGPYEEEKKNENGDV